jgi:multidrug efflux pump subunit AcrA (membrane-fusion protein)
VERKVSGLLAFILLFGPWCASQEAPKAKAPTLIHAKNLTALADKLQLVEDQLKEQQAQISLQQGQIAEQQAQIGQLKQQLGQNASDLREQQLEMQKSTNQMASLQSAEKEDSSAWNTQNLEKELLDAKKSLDGLEHPVTLRYKGITLTPGGFIDASLLRRSRNENADLKSNLNAAPYNGIANAALSEFRMDSRESRLSLMGEGMVGTTKLTGYYELDFMGQAPTANQVQSNSFTPRQRQLWAQAAFSNGLTFTAGQTYSLITTDRIGIATRAEFNLLGIDQANVAGYNYVRQASFRITENFNNRVWAAFEVANPETSQPNASFVPANLFGFNNSANAASPNGNTLNYLAGSTNGFSTNLAPDLIAKIAWQPGWGHYEIKGLGRFFRDRINGHNNQAYGAGIGMAAILPILRNKMDFTVQGLAGQGIDRYGQAQGPDVTLRPDGSIVPIRALHAMTGLEVHATPKLDVYSYGGNEYYGRAAYTNTVGTITGPAGYGSPLVNNTNCEVEVVPTGGAACGAQDRDIKEAVGGFWYRFYRGPIGTMQYGAEYENIKRTTWRGITGAPVGEDTVVLTSLRFFLP